MNRMISYGKLSKKEKKAYNAKRRVVWGFCPVTRKKKSAKVYNRKKARRWEEDVPLTALFLIAILSSYPAVCRVSLTICMNCFTRSGSTGASVLPPCLNQLPIIAPSAMASCSRQVSAVIPAPTNSGKSPSALRKR